MKNILFCMANMGNNAMYASSHLLSKTCEKFLLHKNSTDFFLSLIPCCCYYHLLIHTTIIWNYIWAKFEMSKIWIEYHGFSTTVLTFYGVLAFNPNPINFKFCSNIISDYCGVWYKDKDSKPSACAPPLWVLEKNDAMF